MAEIAVRPLEEADLDGYNTVRSLTYNNGDPLPPERRTLYTPGVRTFIAEQNGQIQGACNVLDMTANRGTAVLNCGGIAGVAVLPESGAAALAAP